MDKMCGGYQEVTQRTTGDLDLELLTLPGKPAAWLNNTGFLKMQSDQSDQGDQSYQYKENNTALIVAGVASGILLLVGIGLIVASILAAPQSSTAGLLLLGNILKAVPSLFATGAAVTGVAAVGAITAGTVAGVKACRQSSLEVNGCEI